LIIHIVIRTFKQFEVFVECKYSLATEQTTNSEVTDPLLAHPSEVQISKILHTSTTHVKQYFSPGFGPRDQSGRRADLTGIS